MRYQRAIIPGCFYRSWSIGVQVIVTGEGKNKELREHIGYQYILVWEVLDDEVVTIM